MTAVIQLEGLSKTYGQRQVVNNLSFKVEAGQIYGFLGANGAGKTTTIKMLLSLIAPSAGQATLFGTNIADATEIRRKRVGALVEEAAFYPFMTGRENLEVLARTGNYPKARIETILGLLGLAQYTKERFKNYSTGMKQRLGIAAALLHNPDLLILDEPSNGLDPQGIQALRQMLQDLAKNEGKTIFLSSHLLHEVEQVCDHVAILHQGRLVREGAVGKLLAEKSFVRIEAEPQAQAFELLADFSPKLVDKNIEIQAEREVIPAIVQRLAQANIAIYAIHPMQRSLEALFLELTHV